MSNKQCSKCDGSGWIPYDKNKLVRCDECCPHKAGFARIKQSTDFRLWCKSGCGYVLEPAGSVS